MADYIGMSLRTVPRCTTRFPLYETTYCYTENTRAWLPGSSSENFSIRCLRMNFLPPWHHFVMKDQVTLSVDTPLPGSLPTEQRLARAWAQSRCEHPQCIVYRADVHGDPLRLRRALRQAGVPALELNGAPAGVFEAWFATAQALSEEFLIPVVLFGAGSAPLPLATRAVGAGQPVNDVGWLAARQVALQTAIETSALHQEFRRSGTKAGWIRLGWHADAAMTGGDGNDNGLLLAWSSPLPLQRLRNFSARCAAHVVVEGPGAQDLAADVASQGISVAHWQIAVK